MELFLIFIAAVAFIFLLTALIGAPYVPTHSSSLDKLLAELDFRENDVFVDIGSGDGIVLKKFAEKGFEVVGFEINPFLVAISKFRLRKMPKAKVRLVNFWQVFPLEKVDFLYTFGESRDIEKMFELAKIQANSQKSTVKFISYGFKTKKQKPSQKISGFFIYEILPENSSQSNKNVI